MCVYCLFPTQDPSFYTPQMLRARVGVKQEAKFKNKAESVWQVSSCMCVYVCMCVCMWQVSSCMCVCV
jgi:hypothetical protein